MLKIVQIGDPFSRRIDRVEVAMARDEVNKSLLEQTQEENLLLNEQIKLLE